MSSAESRGEFGLQGERLAERSLKKLGLKTLARRFNTPQGELDLVMRDGETIVFVEVRTVRTDALQRPEESIRRPKQIRLFRAARWFLAFRRLERRPCRFDVVGVSWAAGGEPVVQHFPNAFLPPA